MVEDDVGSDAEIEPVPDVRRSRATVPSYVESDEDDDDVAAAPPKDSRVAVLYAGGQWYEGTVVDVLDGSRALVRFDNYETANQVNFASAPFRITRFGPEPVPQGRGEKRKTPTSSRPSKRPRRSDSIDEDYQPTAGDAEED